LLAAAILLAAQAAPIASGTAGDRVIVEGAAHQANPAEHRARAN
jgi:hypothetical protein